VDDSLVCRVCIDTFVSPDLMGTYLPETCRKKEVNTLRKIMQQVGFIYKIVQRSTVNKTKYSALRGDM